MTSGRKTKTRQKIRAEVGREVQVRMDDGALRFFQHFSQAWAFFMNQRSAWKISWTMPKKFGGKRLRIVKLTNSNTKLDAPAILGAQYVEDLISQVEHSHIIGNDE